MKIIRTHDELCLRENRYNKPKEMCKFIEERPLKIGKKLRATKIPRTFSDNIMEIFQKNVLKIS